VRDPDRFLVFRNLISGWRTEYGHGVFVFPDGAGGGASYVMEAVA